MGFVEEQELKNAQSIQMQKPIQGLVVGAQTQSGTHTAAPSGGSSCSKADLGFEEEFCASRLYLMSLAIC